MTTWVLFAGLPGTGKSTLAAALVERMNALILDKDRVRAALFPGPWIDYSAEQAQLCMQAMVEAATYLTGRGGPPYVFFDGRTFCRQNQRDDIVAAAVRCGARWRILYVTCEDAVVERRLARKDPTHPAQNRDFALYSSLQKQFAPMVHLHLCVDTTYGVGHQLPAIETYLEAAEYPTR
jgi:adenylylsulfate kinase